VTNYFLSLKFVINQSDVSKLKKVG